MRHQASCGFSQQAPFGIETGSMRGCPASQARVARLEWLDRLSVITAVAPVGLACSSRVRNVCQWVLLREGAPARHRLPVADPQAAVDPGLVRSAAVGQRHFHPVAVRAPARRRVEGPRRHRSERVGGNHGGRRRRVRVVVHAPRPLRENSGFAADLGPHVGVLLLRSPTRPSMWHTPSISTAPTRVLRVGAHGYTVMVAPVEYACASQCRRTGAGRIVDSTPITLNWTYSRVTLR